MKSPHHGALEKFTTENEWCEVTPTFSYKRCEYYWRPTTNIQCNAAVDVLNCWTGATTGAYCDTVTQVASPSTNPTAMPSTMPSSTPSLGPTAVPTGNPTPGPTPPPTSQADGLEDSIKMLLKQATENSEALSGVKALLNQRGQAPSCYGRRTEA